jgi:protein ImuA
MLSAVPGEALCRLRQALTTIEPNQGFPLGAEEAVRPLGLPAVDAALGGGLAVGALHELAPAVPAQLGAAIGFALAIAAHAGKLAQPAQERDATGGRQTLWIQTDFAGLEGGTAYGPGLDLFGLPMDRLLILRVARPIDALWAFEEALKSHALAVVLAELPEHGAAADLTATRRLSLAARAGGGLGLLLRHRPTPLASAAMTRWQVAGAPSMPDRFGGLGRTTFELSLNRNRRGRCGRFIVSWDHGTRTFIPPALSLGLAATARDRPADARIAAFR